MSVLVFPIRAELKQATRPVYNGVRVAGGGLAERILLSVSTRMARTQQAVLVRAK